MKSAIVGRRSWIAEPLARKLREIGSDVTFVEKKYAALCDFSDYQAVYLIAGRARPSIQERMEELHLVAEMANLKKPPWRLVYVSSLAVEREPTPYAQTKLACEKIILSKEFGRVVRPPVIYGPTQDANSDMLIPSIARALAGKVPLIFKEPLKPFYLMHVDDVCNGMRLLGTGQIHTGPLTRTLNLRSNYVSPLDIIQSASPGLPFQVLEGWSTSYPTMRPFEEDGTYSFTWTVNPQSVRDTIEQHVKVLYGADVK